MTKEKNIKRILGLDLGVASLGWAINTYDEDKDEWFIEDFGVRLWNPSEVSKTLASKTKERREKRSIRRSIRRRRQRKNDLINIFTENKLLTRNEIELHFEKLITLNNDYSSEREDLNPLLLRNKGLEEKITPLQLFILTLNISKHRGYENLFSIEKEERLDASRVLVEKYEYPIKAIMNANEFNGNGLRFSYKNKGESEKYPNRIKRESFLFLRSDVRKEYEKIISIQVNNKVISKDIGDKLIERLFMQRFFEDASGPRIDETNFTLEDWKNVLKANKQNYFPSFHELVGKCTFFPDKERLSKSSVYSDIFIIINELSKITEKLSEDERKNIYNDVILDYLNNISFTKTSVDKIFKKHNINANYKETGVVFETKNFFLKKLKNLDEEFVLSKLKNINNIDEFYNSNSIKEIEKIGNIFANYMTPQKIIEEVRKTRLFNIDNENEFLDKIRKIGFSKGRLNVSKKFIIYSLDKILNNGEKYQILAYELQNKNIERNIENVTFENLSINDALKRTFRPSLGGDYDMIRNAVVYRSINQTRMVIRALLKKYGTFMTINFESARDLYAGETERKKIKNQNDKNEKNNETIKIELENKGIDPTVANVQKYKLWEQQKKSRDSIGAIDLYDINLSKELTLEYVIESCEVDHIVPYSVSNNNTIWNKVITSRNNNQSKGKKTPIEWFRSQGFSEKEIENWKKNLRNIPFFKGREMRRESVSNKFSFLTQESSARNEEKGFESKDLNDIRYISRYFGLYLKKEFGNYSRLTNKDVPRINGIKGFVTSTFRREWLKYNNPWGLEQKVREITPYHHSVDAIILSQFEKYSDIQFSTFFVNLKSYWRFLRRQMFDSDIRLSKNEARIELENMAKEFFKFNNEKNFVSNYLINRMNDFVNYLDENIDVSEREVDFNLYLRPLIQNFSNKIIDLIPVKLSIQKETKLIEIANKETGVKELKEYIVKIPKYESIIPIEEWANKNNKSISDFSWPSYKVEKRIRGPITSSQKPKSLKEFNEKPDKYFKDNNENIWEKSEYLGIDLKTGEKVDRYSLIKNSNDSNKMNNFILGVNEYFEFEKKLYVYKGMAAINYISAPSPFLNYNGVENFNKIFEYRPRINLNKTKNFKKINISVLGKSQ